MSAEESPAPIKTEREDETCADVFEYDEARIKTERALLYVGHEVKEEMVIGPTEILRPPPGTMDEHNEDGLELLPYRKLQQMTKALSLPSSVKKEILLELLRAKMYKTQADLDRIEHRVNSERQKTSSGVGRITVTTLPKESLVPIKTEPEEETCAEVFEYDEALIKSERALLYANHEVKVATVIGPTEIRRPPPGVNYPYWEAARRAVANAGVDNEVEYLRRLYSSRLVLRDAADELLCARCGQWSLTAAELHQHSTEHPRDYLQHNAPATYHNCFRAQPTRFTDQRELTSRPTTPSHQRDTTFELKDDVVQPKVVSKLINALSCDICSKSYSNIGKLNKHKLMHSRMIFSCHTCGKNFTQKKNLSDHMFIHNGSKPFECVRCGKKFFQKYHLSHHMRIYNGFSDCLQPACSTHLGNDFQAQFGAFIDQRDYSSQPTTSSRQLDSTFELKDNVLKPKVVPKLINALSCDICGKSYSNINIGNLNKHKLIHSRVKPFSCDTCGKSFNYEYNLSQHMIIHNRSLTCNECGKKFSHKYNLSRHMLIHNK